VMTRDELDIDHRAVPGHGRTVEGVARAASEQKKKPKKLSVCGPLQRNASPKYGGPLSSTRSPATSQSTIAPRRVEIATRVSVARRRMREKKRKARPGTSKAGGEKRRREARMNSKRKDGGR